MNTETGAEQFDIKKRWETLKADQRLVLSRFIKHATVSQNTNAEFDDQ